MGRYILGLIVSIIMVIGGLSGRLVLRGTNSSGTLVIVGILYLIYDIYLIVKYKRNNP